MVDMLFCNLPGSPYDMDSPIGMRRYIEDFDAMPDCPYKILGKFMRDFYQSVVENYPA